MKCFTASVLARLSVILEDKSVQVFALQITLKYVSTNNAGSKTVWFFVL